MTQIDEIIDSEGLETLPGDTIPGQTFEQVRELANVTMAIAQGRAALDELDRVSGDFKEMQKEELLQTIQTVLQESREALQEASKNYEAIDGLARDLNTFAKDVLALSDQVVEMDEQVRRSAEEIMDELKRDREALAAHKVAVEARAVGIEDAWAEIRVAQKKIKEDRRFNADRQRMLERGFAELKSKKN